MWDAKKFLLISSIHVYLELYPKKHCTAPSGERSNVFKICLPKLVMLAYLDPQRTIDRQSSKMLQLPRIAWKNTMKTREGGNNRICAYAVSYP